jgi:hypothetical protein
MQDKDVTRRVLVVVLQLALSFLVVGLLLPSLLARMPSIRDSTKGPLVVLVAAGTIFLLLRLVWPRPKNG